MRAATAMLLLSLLGLPLSGVAGNTHESLARIQRTAHDFLSGQHRHAAESARIEVDTLDARLRLPACGGALEAYLAPGARPVGATTVGVRCPGPAPWSVFVPARVQVFEAVLVAARPLPRATPLSAGDTLLARHDLTALPGGYLTSPAQAAGKRLKYPVAPGTVLTPLMLEAPLLVRRGQSVTVVSATPGIEVRLTGEALANAAAGDRVPVRNRATGRVLEGVVTATGLVELQM